MFLTINCKWLDCRCDFLNSVFLNFLLNKFKYPCECVELSVKSWFKCDVDSVSVFVNVVSFSLPALEFACHPVAECITAGLNIVILHIPLKTLLSHKVEKGAQKPLIKLNSSLIYFFFFFQLIDFGFPIMYNAAKLQKTTKLTDSIIQEFSLCLSCLVKLIHN